MARAALPTRRRSSCGNVANTRIGALLCSLKTRGSGHNPPARRKTPERRCANLREIDLGGRMPRNVAIGLGLMEFPFDGVAGFWRWVDLCEAGGIDSLWQTDRMVSRAPVLHS